MPSPLLPWQTAQALEKTLDQSFVLVTGSLYLVGEALENLEGAPDRALGELAGVGRMLANPHLLIRPFLRREAVASSRIEGTITRLDQLFLFEAEPEHIAHPSDVTEVVNYVLALEHGLQMLQKGTPLCLRLIREVHGKLMEGARGGEKRAGEFRQCAVGPAHR